MPWFHFSIDSTQWWLNYLSWGRGCWPRPLRPRSRRSAPRRVSGACRRARTSRWTEAPTHGPGNWKIVSGQFRCCKLKSNMLFYIFFWHLVMRNISMYLLHFGGLEVWEVIVLSLVSDLYGEGGQTPGGVLASETGVRPTWNKNNLFLRSLVGQIDPSYLGDEEV